MRRHHVVWDWNGTLFDDVGLIIGATTTTFAELGLRHVGPDDYRVHYTRPISVFYQRLLGRPLIDGEWERLDETFHTHYRRGIAECRLSRGAEVVLGAVAERGWSQSLCSMYPHEELVEHVHRLEVASYLSRIDGLRGPRGGRKRDHLERHIESLGVEPQGVVVVGDSLDDAEAATDVGAVPILVASGLHDESHFSGVDVPVVRTMEQVLDSLDAHMIRVGP